MDDGPFGTSVGNMLQPLDTAQETRIMRRAIVILGLLTLMAIPASALAQTAPILCGPQAGPTPAPECYSGPTAIAIRGEYSDRHFDPPATFVKAGTTVTWTNDDYETHTVTADDGSFASGPIEPGQQFSHTFEYAGAFVYHCDYHPSRFGGPFTPRVIVTN